MTKRELQWLTQLTALPTVAGVEDAVMTWVAAWARRRKDVRLVADQAGNLVLTQRRRTTRDRVWITAHMDHPGFVLSEQIDAARYAFEFRGGVLDAYFDDASVEVFAADGRRTARVESLVRDGRSRSGVLRLTGSGPTPQAGDIGRWAFTARQLGMKGDLLHANACDDLAGVAAALAAFDRLRAHPGAAHVGVLLTRAEEVGFVGAIAACQDGTIPTGSRLICLETSRSFADSPIGGGPVVRVGDASSVFTPQLTAAVTSVARSMAAKTPSFDFQRKLMDGGSCEATAFTAYGFAATCVCLALGNYHNMGNLAEVESGAGLAQVKPEVISMSDFSGLVDLLTASVVNLDAPSARDRDSLDTHFASLRYLVKP